jgi:hypothetical protein
MIFPKSMLKFCSLIHLFFEPKIGSKRFNLFGSENIGQNLRGHLLAAFFWLPVGLANFALVGAVRDTLFS